MKNSTINPDLLSCEKLIIVYDFEGQFIDKLNVHVLPWFYEEFQIDAFPIDPIQFSSLFPNLPFCCAWSSFS